MNFVLKNKNRVVIDPKATIGENVIIYENTRIDGACEIGDNVTIFPNSYLSNCKVGKGTKVFASFIENSEIGSCCSISAYSCVKGGTKLSDFVRMGSGVMLKNTHISEHCEVGSNSVICGATLGKNCKISAGTILAGPCEKNKPKIELGNGVRVGARACIEGNIKIDTGEVIEAGKVIKKITQV